ncbi:acyl-coenzyme A oxidase [Elysia marginata]|uniref:Acyl-coenzyme A oxidase n=1 Tax=Elysia marginata TaxID=1093978 RepID=A0AAV4JAN9_9GAST|nr:acyl-coenzyme A oxidase [Elysia marginata]
MRCKRPEDPQRRQNFTDIHSALNPHLTCHFRPFLPYSSDPMRLHRSMFSDTLSRQSTKEQRDKWLPLAQNYAVVGTYAQTELGHGYCLINSFFVNFLFFEIRCQFGGSIMRPFLGHSPDPFALHTSMFAYTLMRQADQEQMAKWIPLAFSFTAVGTYAQTELGHGSFLRGLETTAEYDVRSREFVLNSPSITASKFWPGGLGKTANHCVVMARLKMSGKDCGMQSFIVPIRDLETHQPLPGVTVGDIGPKFGYSAMDNGFLRLDKVRVPRENMLMRYSQVLEDGTFKHPKNDRLVYGSMTLIRTSIVGGCGRALAKAATIATRYSTVRRQSEIAPKSGEVQVIDFQTQQHKLFTQIASAYALINAGKFAADLYNNVAAKIEGGQLEDLPVLHALTATLKAFSSWEMASGIEQCRMSCGGHGYLLASGIPQIYQDMVPACTYEGENTVMCLQTARFLNKCQEAANRGEKLPPMAHFLQARSGNRKSGLTERMELDELVAAFEFRAATASAEANARLKAQRAQGRSEADAWNASSQLLVQAALAFSHAFTVRAFIESVRNAKFHKSLESVMTQVATLYALDGILRFSGDFRKGNYMSDRQLELVQDKLLDLLAALKPNCVALVDAFDFPDQVLGSALGRWDGNVYEAIMEAAKKSPLNKTQVHPAFFKYQKPFMDWMKTQSKL